MDRNRVEASRPGRAAVIPRLGVVLAAMGLTVGLSPRAWAQAPSEGDRVAEVVEKLLQKQAKDIHRCFAKALADRLDSAGKVEVEVDIGPAGRVKTAKAVARSGSVPPDLATCVVDTAKTWTVEGIEAGSTLVLPFSFTGQASQFVVKGSDAPDRGPPPAKGPGGTLGQAPFRVKVLADEANVHSSRAALTLLTVGPASRVAMHRHPHSGKVLYLVKGTARILGPSGTPPLALREGTAVFLPTGYPHVIETMGRQQPAVFVQVFAPPGPERAYRDPRSETARAEFEVIRDPLKVKAVSAGEPVARAAADVPALSTGAGKITVHTLLDATVTGPGGVALDLMEFAPGTEVARHTHEGSEEFLYVLAGGGTLTVGSETFEFTADDAVYIPANQPHAVKIGAEKTVAVQIYAPGGPEQRFKTASYPPTAKP